MFVDGTTINGFSTSLVGTFFFKPLPSLFCTTLFGNLTRCLGGICRNTDSVLVCCGGVRSEPKGKALYFLMNLCSVPWLSTKRKRLWKQVD